MNAFVLSEPVQTGASADEARVAALQVEGLRVDLDNGSDVIDHIDFSLEPGEILGLVGESGSGKTTLATALLAHARRGARISGGRVRVAGTDFLALDGEGLRRARGGLIGYVAQDPALALNPAIRIGNLLLETLRAHEPTLGREAWEQRLQQTLVDVGLPGDREFLRRFAHQLSGGQQQRVMLALAFILRPKLIVLDEPTTALDVGTRAHILQTVRRLCKEQGVAAVYVSHDLGVIKDLVDRVMVMYAGRIVEVASRERLFERPGHPYTLGLLAAIPEVGRQRVLRAIAGHAPAPGQRPGGCAFAARCERRSAACERAEPALQALDGTQQVACLHPQLTTLPEAESAAPRLFVEGRTPLLELRELNLTYDRQVLFDLDLHVYRGECLAVVGESGSGKTSLARTLAGLGDNATGHLSFDGQPLSLLARQRPSATRHRIQYIFQNPYRALNPRQTVAQCLQAPLEHFFGLKGAACRARIDAALTRVALPLETANKYPHHLSGGERQRVAIARALVCEPEVLICDEVTSALDVSVQAAILALLRELQAEGMTLVFVTHDLGVVRAIADRIVVVKEGRIIEAGASGDVLDRPQTGYVKGLVEQAMFLR
ncbi:MULTISPECIES: ABC transporter ATP-binding protein [unclassified Pseudomonas]|uniref:dipeptide ABC transporter ATP-binding protein n=1 Tax=unclassified Pseudomonas TaxID=196821 RepID=UPI0021C6EC90|nr:MULTISPECIES: ABC transporter ATP-binding protein [unclassified Pseudomonas]MCU1733547.1 ABC transporter ATP-binding protein [Pseudomonas sp. 20P_3.2_Bac4]MCU1742459.1 ABC transporter ATP-binding protein [Pseudomonas sp. 20P_3.2_Bac5]